MLNTKRPHQSHSCRFQVQNQLALFDGNNENDYEHFLSQIVKQLHRKLKKRDIDIWGVEEAISYFNSEISVSNFLDIFECLNELGLKVFLLIDEFDSAKTVFKNKSHFEAFRQLTSVSKYSTCLMTVSRQELSMIENENPNNSVFKGVMYPFQIKGFTYDDISEYRALMEEYYEYKLSDDDLSSIKYYAGSSPYLWSCIGHEIADYRLKEKDVNLKQILSSTSIISLINGFYDSILKCLEHDKDRNGVDFAIKLASVIIGPSFLANEEEINLLISLNYLIDNGNEYVVFSQAFKKFLLHRSYNNDILNNFSNLEKTIKELLEDRKTTLFRNSGATYQNDDDNWITVLSSAWARLKRTNFVPQVYRNQIKSTQRYFGQTETILNVMSLENCMMIIINNWNVFKDKFNNDTLDTWRTKFIECGKARNPVHHNSTKRIYSEEERICINAYCLEIVKQLL